MNTQVQECLNSKDSASKSSLNQTQKPNAATKLERRRRIEELNEARLLREELGEY